ncbi:hypothetical protein SCLCIDRAFT_795303 [Scleroderma citrinum Foug A]|uniref:Uncharacterized protein n=1 Tax=Scleroderma citrinum Foug A TaxID=1036808 RepID=A0A0C3ACE8_9AGAM|nr:hypothetical protein SCLCIDRAFT_795303 [Scleroderma citrinum Foug A]
MRSCRMGSLQFTQTRSICRHRFPIALQSHSDHMPPAASPRWPSIPGDFLPLLCSRSHRIHSPLPAHQMQPYSLQVHPAPLIRFLPRPDPTSQKNSLHSASPRSSQAFLNLASPLMWLNCCRVGCGRLWARAGP